MRLFVGDGGPNIVSSFHVIGQIFDTVYRRRRYERAAHNVQTTTIPAGGSAITEFKMSVPGTFIIVDHSLERAFNRGALAQIKVTGPEDKLVYSGKQFDLVYQPEGAGVRAAATAGVPAPAARNKEERVQLGAAVFANNCQACHQPDGQGVPDAFPPLAGSDYLNGDKIPRDQDRDRRPGAAADRQWQVLQRRDAGLEPVGRGHRRRPDLRLFEVGQLRASRSRRTRSTPTG